MNPTIHPVCFVLLTIRFVVRRCVTWLYIERHGTLYETHSYGVTMAYMVLLTYPSLPLTIP